MTTLYWVLTLDVCVLALASRMLDRQDDDLLFGIVDGIIDNVGIAARDELPNARRSL